MTLDIRAHTKYDKVRVLSTRLRLQVILKGSGSFSQGDKKIKNYLLENI